MRARIEGVSRSVVTAAATLFDDGNTVPFIARYRRDNVDNISADKLRGVESTLGSLRAVVETAEKRAHGVEGRDAKLALLGKSMVELDELWRCFKSPLLDLWQKERERMAWVLQQIAFSHASRATCHPL